MCVLIISTTFVSKISYSKKSSARYQKCTYIFMYFCQILTKQMFSTDFIKILKTSNFMINFPVGAGYSMWMDRHNEDNRRYSQICERA